MMRLLTVFAVPIATTRFQNTKHLNAELVALFTDREREGLKFANQQSYSQQKKAVFESRFDLFSWQDPCIKKLRDLCLQTIVDFTLKLNDLPPETAQNLSVDMHSWFHITRKGGYFTAHNHPNASWSAVYCVSPGSEVEGYPESGALRFLDFKASATMYLDPTNIQLPEPFVSGDRVFKLGAGDFVIFPSYLVHEVAPYFGESERITVALNCWFKDKREPFPG